MVIGLVFAITIQAQATTVSEIQENINRDQNALEGLNDEILGLQDEQDILEEEISDLDAELLNTMAAIGLLEDEIAEKEADIATTQAQYEEAKRIEEEQYEAMVLRIQFMYEQGEEDYLSTLFSAGSFSELLNQASYIEAIYEYDRNMLLEYQATKDLVKALWDQLELDKASLQADKDSMDEQKVRSEERRVGKECL